MPSKALAREAEKFAKSSAYRFGDPLGFSVCLHKDVTLPGKESPALYLDSLGLKKLPEKVMIVCPGNGGLAAECFRRGAKNVIALEPRDRFHEPLKQVFALLSKGWMLENKRKFSRRIVVDWPLSDGAQEQNGNQDLILWPEAVEEFTLPKAIFNSLGACLAEGGKLIVELMHGRHAWVERINSWKPDSDAISTMAQDVFGRHWTGKQPGRRSGRAIYTLEKAKVPEATEPAKKTRKKKKKKKKATKKVTKKAPEKKAKKKKKKAKKKKKSLPKGVETEVRSSPGGMSLLNDSQETTAGVVSSD